MQCKVVLKNYFRHLPNTQLVLFKNIKCIPKVNLKCISSYFVISSHLLAFRCYKQQHVPRATIVITTKQRVLCLSHQMLPHSPVSTAKKSGTGKAPTRKTSICFACSSSASADRASTKDLDPDLACQNPGHGVCRELALPSSRFFPDVVVIKSGNPPSNYLAKPAD